MVVNIEAYNIGAEMIRQKRTMDVFLRNKSGDNVAAHRSVLANASELLDVCL